MRTKHYAIYEPQYFENGGDDSNTTTTAVREGNKTLASQEVTSQPSEEAGAESVNGEDVTCPNNPTDDGTQTKPGDNNNAETEAGPSRDNTAGEKVDAAADGQVGDSTKIQHT